MAEEKVERKTGHSSDQWFKLKTKISKQQRNIVENEETPRKRRETTRRKSKEATQTNRVGRSQKFEDDIKERREGRTTTKEETKEKGRTNFSKVIG